MTDFAPLLSTPRDWPEDWQELRTIDSLLRCSICSEFFNNTTVVPSCSHNYCSLCIRKYLAIESKCPSCYVNVQENKLENNRIIDEIVKSFLKIRNRLLEIVKENVPSSSSSKKRNKIEYPTRSTKKLNRTLVKLKQQVHDRKTWSESKKRQRNVSKGSTSEHSSGNESPVLSKKQKRHSIDDDDDDDFVAIDDNDDANKMVIVDNVCTCDDNDDDADNDIEDANHDIEDANHDIDDANHDIDDADHDIDDADDIIADDVNNEDEDYKATDDAVIDIIDDGIITDDIIVDEDYKATDDIDDDDEVSVIIKRSSSQRSLSSSFRNIEEPTDTKDLVDCPVCREKIHPSKINGHLDTCLTSRDRKDNLRSTSSQSTSDNTESPVGANTLIPQVTKRKSLNKLVYTILSEKQLKQKLKEHGLSIKGDRQTLVKRHHEFCLIYNSECSKQRPKSVLEIVRLVEEGEKKKKKLDNNREKLNFERGQSQEDMDKIKDNYVTQNKDQFSRLINDIQSRENKSGKSGRKKTDRKSPKEGKKRMNLLINKLLISDEDSNSSSADFEITQCTTTPRRRNQSPTGRERRTTSAKSASNGSSFNSKMTKEDCISDIRSSKRKEDTSDDEVNVCDKNTHSSTNLFSGIPEAPSSLLLDQVIHEDSDETSSDSESLLPAFDRNSAVINEIPGTPPIDCGNDSDELEFEN